jgi:hypothetical protein
MIRPDRNHTHAYIDCHTDEMAPVPCTDAMMMDVRTKSHAPRLSVRCECVMR